MSAFELDNVVVGFGIGVLKFDSQVEIEGADSGPFSQGGDSGSLIVDAGHRAVALLFAGSDLGGSNGQGLTYANPIRAVLDALKVDFLLVSRSDQRTGFTRDRRIGQDGEEVGSLLRWVIMKRSCRSGSSTILPGRFAMKTTGLDEARAAKERAKAIFAGKCVRRRHRHHPGRRRLWREG